MNKIISAVIAAVALSLSAQSKENTLFDANLSNFELWMGVPHTSVKGLPEGTYQADDVHKGTPMGLNADVKKVFKMETQNGEPVLHISGEIFGGLTTLKEYENYHLSVRMKWGEKKWPPREHMLRDNGILYHCHGKHGAFWSVWKSSLECQVQETDLGDFIQISGTKAEVRTSPVEGTKRRRFDPLSNDYTGGYISAYPEPDAPHGAWNQIEIYSVGDTSVHVANGHIVMVVEHARKADGTPLTKGQIQIQSEGAECYYKELTITPITDFPKAIKAQLRLKGDPRP